jgi:hypothetical protein
MKLDKFLKTLRINKEPELYVGYGCYAWMLENSKIKVFGNSKVECYVLFANALISEGYRPNYRKSVYNIYHVLNLNALARQRAEIDNIQYTKIKFINNIAIEQRYE